MGFLGYDADALLRLRRAIEDVDDESRRISCGDPLASSSLATYRSAVAAFSDFHRRITAILSCGVTDEYRPVGVGLDVGLTDVVHPASSGWAVTTDPLAPAILDAVAHARRLAELVLAAWRQLLGDPAQRMLLIAELDALDGTGAAAFLTAMGPDRGFAIVSEVALREDAHAAAVGRRVEPASELVSALARALGRSWDHVDHDRWVELLSHADPYVTARVASSTSLPTAALTMVASAALRNFVAEGTEAWVSVGTAGPEDPRTLILRALTRDPVAGRAVLAQMAGDDLPLVLGSHVMDGGVAGAFVRAITDPRSTTADEAGRVLTRVLPALRHEMVSDELHHDLAAAAAPWLDGIALGRVIRQGDAWDWHGWRGDEILGWLAQTSAAADEIARGAATLVPSRWATVFDAPDPVAELHDVGVAVGAAQRAAGDGHVAVARIDDASYHALVSLPAKAVGLVGKGGALVGLGVSAGVSQSTRALGDLWQRNGWPGAPPRVVDVERRERRAAADAKVEHAATIASLTATVLKAPAPPTPDDLSPMEYADALDDYVARGGNPEVRDRAATFGDGFGDGFDGLAYVNARPAP
jgi:hypothetical protein